jgi:hypothetical protein
LCDWLNSLLQENRTSVTNHLRACCATMQPYVKIWSLSITSRHLEQQFWRSPSAALTMSYLDIVGIATSIVVNLIVTRFLYLKHGSWWQPLGLVFISLAHMFIILLFKTFYMRHRTIIQIMQRLLRLLPPMLLAIDLYQHRSKFQLMANNIKINSPWKTLLITIFMNPMLAALSTFNYILPHKTQLVMCSIRLVLELYITTPATGCFLQHIGLGHVVRLWCSRLQTLNTVMFSPVPTPDKSYCTGSIPFMLLPAFGYVSVATLLPTLGTYWIESRQKQQFLASKGYAQDAAEASWPLSAKVLLTIQIYGVIGVSYATALATAWLHEASFPGYCSMLLTPQDKE